MVKDVYGAGCAGVVVMLVTTKSGPEPLGDGSGVGVALGRAVGVGVGVLVGTGVGDPAGLGFGVAAAPCTVTANGPDALLFSSVSRTAFPLSANAQIVCVPGVGIVFALKLMVVSCPALRLTIVPYVPAP